MYTYFLVTMYYCVKEKEESINYIQLTTVTFKNRFRV